MKIFISRLTVIVLLLGAGILIWNSFAPAGFHSNSYWLALIILTTSTIVVHRFLTNPASSPQQFVRHFMLVTFARLFIYLIIIGLFAFFNRPEAIRFVLCFMLMYFVFMVIEVTSLTQFVKK